MWIISDEIYRRINYGPGPAPSLLDLPDDLLERVVIIYGASKAYAMTGWRIGAALAPAHLTKAMAALQSHTTTGANHPAQWAAAAAFTDERVDAEVDQMVAAFRRRRDYLVERFRREAPGIEFVEPHGAFYFFFRVDGIRENDPVTGTLVLRTAHAAGRRRAGSRRRVLRRPVGAAELRRLRCRARAGARSRSSALSAAWSPRVPPRSPSSAWMPGSSR